MDFLGNILTVHLVQDILEMCIRDSLVDFPMYGAVQLLRRTGQGVMPQLAVWGLIRLFKGKARLCRCV